MGLTLSGCSESQRPFANVMGWMLGGPREVLANLVSPKGSGLLGCPSIGGYFSVLSWKVQLKDLAFSNYTKF